MRASYIVKSFISDRFRAILAAFYPLMKHNPTAVGTMFYEATILEQISLTINKKMMFFKQGKRLPPKYGLGFSERCVEIPWLFSQLDNKETLHLDAGSSLNFEAIVALEPLRRKKIFIVNLNPESNCYYEKSISYIYWDLRRPVFHDNTFDSISCISVLEHIGMDTSGWAQNMRYKEHKMRDYQIVVKEFRRILKTGGSCYISVPYGKHTDHRWFQIFDKSMVDNIIAAFGPTSYAITYFTNTDHGWSYSSEQISGGSVFSNEYKRDWWVGAKSVACIRLIK